MAKKGQKFKSYTKEFKMKVIFEKVDVYKRQFEEGGGGVGEVGADGGEFAAAGIVFAEGVEASAEVGGVAGGGHFRAPGAVICGDGAAGDEQLREDFFVVASGGVEGDGGRGGQLGEVRGPGGFDFEEVGEFAGAMEGAVEEAFEGVAGDMRGEVVDGLLEGGGQLRFVGPDIEHAGGKSLVGERVFEGFGVGDVAAGGVEEPCAGFELAEESAVGEMVRGEGTGGGEGHVEGQDVGFGQDGFCLLYTSRCV